MYLFQFFPKRSHKVAAHILGFLCLNVCVSFLQECYIIAQTFEVTATEILVSWDLGGTGYTSIVSVKLAHLSILRDHINDCKSCQLYCDEDPVYIYTRMSSANCENTLTLLACTDFEPRRGLFWIVHRNDLAWASSRCKKVKLSYFQGERN
jgi:hypothetical protein